MPSPRGVTRDASTVSLARRPAVLGLLLLALLPLALGLVANRARWGGEIGFPLDDSWIHLQYGRVMAEGGGLEYNAGEPALGTTAPLWSGLLALAHSVPGDPAAWALALGMLAHLATVMLVLLGARTLGLRAGPSWLAAAWTATAGWLVWGALSGMEIAAAAAVSLAGLLRQDLELRRPGALPVALPALAVATLLRPEMGLLLVFAALELTARGRWRQMLEGGALAALILGPWLAFAHLATGSILPTTLGVKAGGGTHAIVAPVPYLLTVVRILFEHQPVATLLAGGGIALLLARAARAPGSVLCGLWVIGLPLAFGALTPSSGNPLVGNFGRYYFPLLPVIAVLGAASIEPLARALAGRKWLAATLATAALLPGLALLPHALGVYATNLANVRDSDFAISEWLAPRLPPGAVIAVNDIGLLKYRLPEHRVIDLVGIAHPAAREMGRRAQAAGLPWWRGTLAYLGEQRPDFVVVFSSWFPQLAYLEGFTPIHRIEIPGNITMGGDDVVVFSTPWTRSPLRGETMAPIALAWPPPGYRPEDFEAHLE